MKNKNFGFIAFICTAWAVMACLVFLFDTAATKGDAHAEERQAKAAANEYAKFKKIHDRFVAIEKELSK